MTSSPNDDTPAANAADIAAQTTTFKMDRMHIVSAIVMMCITLLVVGAKPVALFWLPFVPLVFAVYVWRSSTTVSAQGLSAQRGFSKPESVSWDDFAGVRFGSSSAFAVRKDESEFVLPGISFNSLPALSAASGGRIPDALTAGRAAADEKVVVIHRDGRQVLMDKEEYERTHPQTPETETDA